MPLCVCLCVCACFNFAVARSTTITARAATSTGTTLVRRGPQSALGRRQPDKAPEPPLASFTRLRTNEHRAFLWGGDGVPKGPSYITALGQHEGGGLWTADKYLHSTDPKDGSVVVRGGGGESVLDCRGKWCVPAWLLGARPSPRGVAFLLLRSIAWEPRGPFESLAARPLRQVPFQRQRRA